MRKVYILVLSEKGAQYTITIWQEAYTYSAYLDDKRLNDGFLEFADALEWVGATYVPNHFADDTQVVSEDVFTMDTYYPINLTLGRLTSA